jgi:hypothetical protein
MSDYTSGYTADQMRKMRTGAISLWPVETNYVVTVPYGTSERVAYGMAIPLSKRAAGQLARAVKSLYAKPGKDGKPRAIMVKTAIKEKIIG